MKKTTPMLLGNFLGKALELAPDDADYLYMDAYIDGMAAVRDLV
jgi:hypothetical protein